MRRDGGLTGIRSARRDVVRSVRPEKAVWWEKGVGEMKAGVMAMKGIGEGGRQLWMTTKNGGGQAKDSDVEIVLNRDQEDVLPARPHHRFG